ncbi:MAG: hypothetical protein AMJ65_08600 [Phycisphaerae bacterium SG8_4]|nr:MAG: hypothetical protein AMJ65_08600 [Phycisphaerae bacterium SG8_4]
MRPKTESSPRERSGAVVIISMIFVVVFAALAVCLATMSGNNVQLASNHHQLGCAMASAESGLEVMRYWLTRVTIPNSTAQSDYFATIVNSVGNDLVANEISNMTLDANGLIPAVTLQTAEGQSFTGQIAIQAGQPNVLEVYATGGNGRIMRTIKVCYEIGPARHPVFDYGIATRGPLHMQGSPDVDGLNENSEADVYIESENVLDALSMAGSSAIAGNVRIGNPNAQASVGNSCSIGGESGQGAIDNHVAIGAPPFEFPGLDIVRFEDYVESDLDPGTDTSNDMTLDNIRILADTNPHFSGNVSLRGIVFVESPNIVRFTGNTDIIGIIIGDGDLDLPSEDNELIFLGNVGSQSVSELGAEFGDLRQETGTFLVAPGFSVSFNGSFETLNGVIAASAVDFSGNSGGIINGAVMNYGDDPMTLDSSVGLLFDRSEAQEIPAGFESEIVLHYNPDSYSVVAL